MIAARWLIAGTVSAAGALGGATGVTGLVQRGSTPESEAPAPAAPRADSLSSRSYRQTLDGVQQATEVVLRNIAHADTPGYRAVRPLFAPHQDPTGQTQGVMRPAFATDFSAGTPVETGRPLDVQIAGTGHLQLRDGQAPGGIAYTRLGRLRVSPQGFLACGEPGDARPRPLAPPVAVPEGATQLRVLANGGVEAQAPETQEWVLVGEIQLAAFARPEALHHADHGLLHATDAAGPQRTGTPGARGFAALRSGVLEGSNVDRVAETEQLRSLQAWSARLTDALR